MVQLIPTLENSNLVGLLAISQAMEFKIYSEWGLKSSLIARGIENFGFKHQDITGFDALW